jgi:hypothetical protein
VVVEGGVGGGGDLFDGVEVAVGDGEGVGGVGGGHEAGGVDGGGVRVVAEEEVVVALFVGQAEVVEELVEEVGVAVVEVEVALVGP